MKKSIFSLIAILLCSIMHAQENNTNAVVNVENDYNPIVVQVKKKEFTPTIESNSSVTPLELVFSKRSSPYDSFTSERNVKELLPRQKNPTLGYARLGYGTTNDIDAKFAYRLATGRDGDLSMLASFNGYKCSLDGIDSEWDSRMFSTLLDACYTHSFKTARISVGGNFSDKVFNYYNYVPGMETDKQNNTVYNIYANGFSILSAPLSAAFNIGFTHNRRAYSTGRKDAVSENHATIGTRLGYEVYDSHIREFGAGISADIFAYNSTLRDASPSYSNVFSLDINPFMGLIVGDWNMRIGARMNLRNRNGAIFAIAPDLSIDGKLTKQLAIYAKISGGRRENNFAVMDDMTPYWNFIEGSDCQPKPTYRIADIEAGARIAYGQLSADLYAGYTYTKDDLLQTTGVNCVALAQDNTNDIFIGTRAGYDYGGIADVSISARYSHKTCDYSDLLIMHPELELDINAEVRPIKDLTVETGYRFIRYTKGENLGRLDNKNDLYARVSYKICKAVGIFLQGNNLFNSSFHEYPGIKARGIRVSAGASVNF